MPRPKEPLFVLPNSYIPNWVWTLRERAEVKQRSKSLCIFCNTYVSFWDSQWPLCEAESRIKDLNFFRVYYPNYNISNYHFDSELRDLIRANRINCEKIEQRAVGFNIGEREIRLKQLKEQRVEKLRRTQSLIQRRHYYDRLLSLGVKPNPSIIRTIQNELFEIQVSEHLAVLKVENIPTLHTFTNFR